MSCGHKVHCPKPSVTLPEAERDLMLIVVKSDPPSMGLRTNFRNKKFYLLIKHLLNHLFRRKRK
jgi:hypothetical protein